MTDHADAAKRAGRRLADALGEAERACERSRGEDCRCGLAYDALLAAWDALAGALGEVARREPYGVAARALARAAAPGGEGDRGARP